MKSPLRPPAAFRAPRGLINSALSAKANRLPALLLCLLLCHATSSATAQIAPVSVVALSGQQAPGLPDGVTFSPVDFAFGFGYMNNTGHVAFLAFVTGPGITPANDRGIWVGRPGALALAAREGDPAPDLPTGVVYGTFNETPSLSGNGAVAFRATLAGPGVTSANDLALFGGPVGSVKLAARLGGPAPGGPVDTYGSFTASSINSLHQLAFGGTTGAGVETIWFGVPGNISRSTSVGDPADGFPPGAGVTYADLFLGGVLPPVQLNSAGQIAFSGTVVGPGIGGANDDGLWGGLPLSPHLIARAGLPPPEISFVWFINPVISDSGLAAFEAATTNAPDRIRIYRIIIGSAASLDEVAVEGEVAPLGGGAVFNATGGLNGNFVPRLNNANGVAFRSALAGAGVTPANDVGIWGHNDKGWLSLLAREGNPLPAAGTNVTIGAINNTPPALNGANRIAFRARLAGEGINFGNDDVIVAANALGDLVLAAREGQVVEVAPGEFRTFGGFGNITGPGTQDGSSTSWTDDCRLLFRADFFGGGGGTGLFVADVNATCRPIITGAPTPVIVTLGGEAVFTVTASGPDTSSPGPISLCATVAEPRALCYRWRKDGVELADGPTGSGSVIGGAASSTLHVLGCGAADAGMYDVVVSDLCGSTPSGAAALTLNLGLVTVISVSDHKLNLAWSGAPSVRLQSATNLTAAAAWIEVPDTAGKSSAAVPMIGPQMFFRLVSP